MPTVRIGEDLFGSLFLAPLGLRLRKEAREDVRGDEFAPCGDSLEVRSPVAKAWWERAGGITYQSEPFALVDSGREGSKHRYRFKKGGSASSAGGTLSGWRLP